MYLVSFVAAAATQGGCPFAPPALLPGDIARAEQPRPNLLGTAGRGVNDALNRVLKSDKELRTRSCEDFSINELNELVRKLWCHRDESLDDVYTKARVNDGRKLRFCTLEQWEMHWQEEEKYLNEKPHLHRNVLGSKCAEVLLLYTHHLSTPSRMAIKKLQLELPLMAQAHHPMPEDEVKAGVKVGAGASCQNGHAGYATDDCTKTVWENCAAEGKTSCAKYSDCISVSTKAWSKLAPKCPRNETDFKVACSQPTPGSQKQIQYFNDGNPQEWPEEVEWWGKGFGPYPFWGHDVTATSDIKIGANIHTHWSSTKNAELFEHAKCQMALVGSKAGNVPCKHLFLGEIAYFYTSDESFCCISGDKQRRQGFGPLTAPQRNWTKALKYVGTAAHKTPFFEGQIKNFSLFFPNGGPPFRFWYYTDMNGRPVEQGEGCQIMPRTANCRGPSYLWHNYNPDNFTAVTNMSWDIFRVPEVCQKTTSYCLFP